MMRISVLPYYYERIAKKLSRNGATVENGSKWAHCVQTNRFQGTHSIDLITSIYIIQIAPSLLSILIISS